MRQFMSPLCAAHCQHLISLEPSISSQLEEAQYLHAYWKIPSQLTLPEPSTSQPPILWCLHQTSLKIQHGFLLSGSAIVRKCVCVCVCVCVWIYVRRTWMEINWKRWFAPLHFGLHADRYLANTLRSLNVTKLLCTSVCCTHSSDTTSNSLIVCHWCILGTNFKF